MNAGTSLGEISDRLIWVEWLDSEGVLRRSNRADLSFQYGISYSLSRLGMPIRPNDDVATWTPLMILLHKS